MHLQWLIDAIVEETPVSHTIQRLNEKGTGYSTPLSYAILSYSCLLEELRLIDVVDFSLILLIFH